MFRVKISGLGARSKSTGVGELRDYSLVVQGLGLATYLLSDAWGHQVVPQKIKPRASEYKV